MRKTLLCAIITAFTFLTQHSYSQVNPQSQWTWIKESKIPNDHGVYGTQGVASPSNHPGARGPASRWLDHSGKLWIFGGSGYSALYQPFGELNDLWKYDPVTNQWTWMNGSNSPRALPVYGIRGVSSPTNTPGAKNGALTWTDKEGMLWLFGGISSGTNGSTNDLWKYNPTINQWTWMHGDSVPRANQVNVYDSLGVASPTNKPACQFNMPSWVDESGDLWMLGSYQRPLWKYNIASNQWTLMQISLVSSPSERYGAMGWADGEGKFWLFGGYGINQVTGHLNDLWVYDPNTNSWTFLGGGAGVSEFGQFGVKGVPHSNNWPPAAERGGAFTDKEGKFWFYGGNGRLTDDNRYGNLNDLWKYDPLTKQWTWVKGNKTVGVTNSHGTLGVQASGNRLGGRKDIGGWADSAGNFWFYGGSQYSDIWKLSNSNLFTYYKDSDGDSYGNLTAKIRATQAPLGYVSDSTDCDDSRGEIFPGAIEQADQLDNDCDGLVDEDFTTRSLKVNLYSGANPYNNAEWNNWNVSSSLSSAALKYSDATTSSISAALSKSDGIGDHGTSYGGVMAPPEVLRHVSSSSTARTLTFSGLTASKTYSLELYASRANTGNSTKFTINGMVINIVTDNNKTAKASFTGLAATASGTLVVNIDKINNFNYLNGFILTESNGSGNQAPSVNAGTDKSITLPTASVTLDGSGTDEDGSIASYSWSKVSGPAAHSFSSTSSPSTTISNLVEGTYVFRLTVTDNGGATGFDDVQVVVAPAPPPPGTKFLKVNLFGGSNPYDNTAWNNWNVTSGLNSGALKYSDATTSSVSAALSNSDGVGDNGSSYGGTMAPPEVLRHVSSGSAPRTLTFSGLSASKTYSLELYASRNNTGHSTIFSMNNISVTIKTDKNKSTNVLFSELVPNGEGKLTLTIKSANTYNYLNGFVLTEVKAQVIGLPIVNAGPDQTITLPTNSLVLRGSASSSDGTIDMYKWTKIDGPFCGTMDPEADTMLVYGMIEGTYKFRLNVYDNRGFGSDEVTIVVNAEPMTTTKYIKVNLFGGSNPYNNADWKNWNVTSSLSSGVLKYSDATTSSVSAVLSKSDGIGDHGTAYGGTMAPPEVLRHTSSGSAERTLTFAGLSTDKTYSLELYASRANTGNSTRFTINGTEITIVTDNNKTNNASFTGLVPTADGQLVVILTNVAKFNYLNGFILTEITPVGAATTGMTTSNSSPELLATSQQKGGGLTVSVNALQLSALPNPSQAHFTVRLSSNSSKPVTIQLVDALGRVVERKQNVAAIGSVTLGQNIKAGIYYLEAQQGAERQRVKLIKL